MRNIRKINIKNCSYYIFNDMINIKTFDSNLLNIDKKSFKNTDVVIYNIEYIAMKTLDHNNIDTENPLCFIFNNVDGYIEENNGYKCLIFASTKTTKRY